MKCMASPIRKKKKPNANYNWKSSSKNNSKSGNNKLRSTSWLETFELLLLSPISQIRQTAGIIKLNLKKEINK